MTFIYGSYLAFVKQISCPPVSSTHFCIPNQWDHLHSIAILFQNKVTFTRKFEIHYVNVRLQEDQATMRELARLSEIQHPNLVRYMKCEVRSQEVQEGSGSIVPRHFVSYVRFQVSNLRK